MAAIDEGIVREYFEQNGFFVRQMRKHAVQARRKTSDEEIDLVVYNPTWTRDRRKPDFFLFANELPCLHRAVVSIKPWHTDVFTPGTLRSSPELFRFLEDKVLREAVKFFPSEEIANTGEAGGVTAGEVTKILVLPALPTQEPFRTQSVELLKARGVDCIISFRAMLLDLIDKVEVNRHYRKSDTLEVIRILKNYDLVRDPQLDLLPRIQREPKESRDAKPPRAAG
ncbi:hypothetical protein IMCC26134_05455 [Verrucomicrobia bacterium IMCC26134]|nr:hypothetical protein IMCC26134_05455 [Verrucomicrobia bacterium IMCC26134]